MCALNSHIGRGNETDTTIPIDPMGIISDILPGDPVASITDVEIQRAPVPLQDGGGSHAAAIALESEPSTACLCKITHAVAAGWEIEYRAINRPIKNPLHHRAGVCHACVIRPRNMHVNDLSRCQSRNS